MKVILLDDVTKVGRRGEVRDVSDGYARNYLIPKRLALSATAGNLKNLEHIKKQQEAKADRVKACARASRRSRMRSAGKPPKKASCSARSPRRTSRIFSARAVSRWTAGASRSMSPSRRSASTRF